MTSSDHRFLAVNTAHVRIYGWTPERIIGQSPRILTSSAVNETFLTELHAATVIGGWVGRLLNHNRRGEKFEVQLQTLPLWDAQGHRLLFGVACRPGEESGLMCSLLETAWQGWLRIAPLPSVVGARAAERWKASLSPRERETFRLIGRGLRTVEIARKLGVSFNTARVFTTACRVKLGCPNIEALRALAARLTAG